MGTQGYLRNPHVGVSSCGSFDHKLSIFKTVDTANDGARRLLVAMGASSCSDDRV